MDRRLLLVPFLKRVEPNETKSFNTLFPEEEIKNLVNLSTHISPERIKRFLLVANQHPELREIALEHYEDGDEQSAMLQHYVNERIVYREGGFVAYGSPKKVALIHDFERWAKKQPFDFLSGSQNKKIPLSQTLLPYIKLNYPDWVDVKDGRKSIGGSFGSSPKGIWNIDLNQNKKTNSSHKSTSFKAIDWNQFRNELWWVESTSSEVTSEGKDAQIEVSVSDDVSENVSTTFDQRSGNVNDDVSKNVSDDVSENVYEEGVSLDLVSNLLSTLGGSALPEGHTDLDKAKQIRHKLIYHGENMFLGTRKTILINEHSNETTQYLILLEQLFYDNEIIALDTEYVPCPKNTPHNYSICYIQVGGSNESPIFIIGKKFFSFFHKLFMSWLSKPNSLLLGYYLMADLPILATTFNILPETFEHKVFDFYLFFRFLSPQLNNHGLKDWYLRIFGEKMDKTLQKTNWSKVILNSELIEYMKKDIQTLLDFLGYLPYLKDFSWRNTWETQIVHHDPFITSYLLDQVLIPTFVEITLKGVDVDEEDLQNYIREQERLLQENLQLLKCSLSQLRSAKQLESHLETQNITGMFDCLQMWPRTEKSGQIALGVEAIKEFIHNQEKTISDECAQWFVNYFQYKQISSNIMNSNKLFKCVTCGKLYPSWDFFGAATGRITTRKPALNSTPREPLFRSMFKAPDNYCYIVADYAMIEIVIMAVVANDGKMLNNLYEKKDLHMYLASQVLGQPYKDLMDLKQSSPGDYKQKRTPMKAVNFGLLYGMGADTLHKRLFSQGYAYTEEYVRHIHAVWTET